MKHMVKRMADDEKFPLPKMWRLRLVTHRDLPPPIYERAVFVWHRKCKHTRFYSITSTTETGNWPPETALATGPKLWEYSG